MDFRLSIAALLLLAACGGNPITNPDGGGGDGDGDGDGDGGSSTALIPESVSMNLSDADLAGWKPGDDTLSIRMTAQDATALTATYNRDATLDVGGYQAYSYQSTTSNRKVVALVREAGSVKAVTAVEAGQFANYHGGGNIYRADVYRAPVAGVGESFDYSGSYAGLLNSGPATPGGPGGSLNPTQAHRTTGRALITADFTEMSVSGGVDRRRNVDTGERLKDIALWKTGINANGTFTDAVHRADDSGWTAAGTYAGAFGGIDASEVAAVMVFNPKSEEPLLFEHGAIVLPSCASGTGGAACP